MTLPKILYVRTDRDADGEQLFDASRSSSVLVEDDGPTTIGTYELIETRILRKDTPGMEPVTLTQDDRRRMDAARKGRR